MSKLDRYVELTETSNNINTHSASIFNGKRLIIKDTNTDRSCYNGNIMCSMHAEVAVIRSLLKNFRGHNKNSIKRKIKSYRLIVIRPDMKDSTPCSNCMWYIKDSWIKAHILFKGQ